MHPEVDSGKERLQKLLARAGFGSRRACEELIVDGRVSVNGTTVSVLGTQAHISHDVVTVDGERVRMPQNTYWLAHKPPGRAVSEREAERFIQDFIPGEHPRLFTVGRLDKGSSGLMFVTNDGRVANILTHPRYKVPKSYHITVTGELRFATASQIERALYYTMNGGRFERLRILKSASARSLIRLTAYEGLPGALRDIFLKYDHPIKQIERVRVGPLELGEMQPGHSRKMHKGEIDALIEYCRKAEAGELEYEHDLVTPLKFGRDAHAPEFKRKDTGHRGPSAGGQKKVMARTHGRRTFSNRRDRGGPPVDNRPGSHAQPTRPPKASRYAKRGPNPDFEARPERGPRPPRSGRNQDNRDEGTLVVGKPHRNRAKPPSFGDRKKPMSDRAIRRKHMGRPRDRD